MITREEIHKGVINEVKKENWIKREKKLLIIVAIIAGIILSIYLYARFIGTSFIKTHEYVIKNSTIPTSYRGVKIVHISDLLYGSTIDNDDLIYLKKEIKKINPDIITFTGDLIYNKYQTNKDDLNNLNDFFKSINAKIGKYAIKGDMDNTTYDLVMKDTDFIILDNTYEMVYNNSKEPIVLVGLNSNIPTKIKIDNPNNYYVITLIHNYDLYSNYNISSSLVLAGHNLRGEIYLPFKKGITGNNKYKDSYYNINDEDIYISNGLGSINKIRLFNHPSINVYRLYNN